MIQFIVILTLFEVHNIDNINIYNIHFFLKMSIKNVSQPLQFLSNTKKINSILINLQFQ